MKKITGSLKETHKLARDLAKKTLNIAQGKAIVIGLSGELGSGKTTFIQGFAKALGIKTKVVSPTFVILKKFKITNLKYQKSNLKTLVHIDCYRIERPKEILDLGWEELINNPQNIILVEWAEKIKKIFPKKYFWINFSHISPKQRSIDSRFIK